MAITQAPQVGEPSSTIPKVAVLVVASQHPNMLQLFACSSNALLKPRDPHTEKMGRHVNILKYSVPTAHGARVPKGRH
jgi:hypothetical protein